MKYVWILVVLLFLSLYARADAIVTLDFSQFDVGPSGPVPILNYFDGGTITNGSGQQITGPNYRIDAGPLTFEEPGGTPYAFSSTAFSWIGNHEGVLYVHNGFNNQVSFSWDTNPSYVIPPLNFAPPVYVMDNNGNLVQQTVSSTITGDSTGIETISFDGAAYRLFFGYLEDGNAQAFGYSGLTLDLASAGGPPRLGAPDPPPTSAPDPRTYSLVACGLALMSVKKLRRQKTE